MLGWSQEETRGSNRDWKSKPEVSEAHEIARKLLKQISTGCIPSHLSQDHRGVGFGFKPATNG